MNLDLDYFPLCTSTDAPRFLVRYPVAGLLLPFVCDCDPPHLTSLVIYVTTGSGWWTQCTGNCARFLFDEPTVDRLLGQPQIHLPLYAHSGQYLGDQDLFNDDDATGSR